MRTLTLLLLIAAPVFAQDQPTEARLRAEIEHLKAQLAVAVQQLEIASLPQVMRTRLAAAEAAAKFEAAQKKDAPKPEPAK